jgi:hypothetical protein
VTLVNANKNVRILPSGKTGGESNYLLGDDPSAWKIHIPQYGRLSYSGVYPGVDLVFYGKGSRVEHDFVVAPGADYRQIKLRYEGASKLSVSANGDLHVALAGGDVIVHVPRVYQTVHGSQRGVSGGFILLADNQAAFRVGDYNAALPLVIDPVLDYSTYIANLNVSVAGAAVDAAGNTYITGITFSSSYPTTSGAFQTHCPSCPNTQQVYITKLNATGTALVYSTFLGGSNANIPTAIAVDSNGNAVVVGTTASTDFPLKNPLPSGPVATDGFVSSLSADGSSLNFSTRLGGAGSLGYDDTFPDAVAVDSSGAVYVVGSTQSPNIPFTTGALNAGTPNNGIDPYAFLTKILPNGALSYGAILGDLGPYTLSNACCVVDGVSVDATGNAYVTGTTTRTSAIPGPATVLYPTTPGAFQSQTMVSAYNAPFVSKVAPDGKSFVYSTLVGQGSSEGLAVNLAGQALLIVGTNLQPFPVTANAYSSLPAPTVIAELSADGTGMPYATYFYSPSALNGTYVAALAVDAGQHVWLAGSGTAPL